MPDQVPKPTGVERSFACEECVGLSFKTSEELSRHEREVHQIKINKSAEVSRGY